MNDRTIMQMEIHPKLIEMRSVRAENAKKFAQWMQNAAQSHNPFMGLQMPMAQQNQSPFGLYGIANSLIGGIGRGGLG